MADVVDIDEPHENLTDDQIGELTLREGFEAEYYEWMRGQGVCPEVAEYAATPIPSAVFVGLQNLMPEEYLPTQEGWDEATKRLKENGDV